VWTAIGDTQVFHGRAVTTPVVIPSTDVAAFDERAQGPESRWPAVTAGLALVAALALVAYLLSAAGPALPTLGALGLLVALAGVGVFAAVRERRRVGFGAGVVSAVAVTLVGLVPAGWVVTLLLLLSTTLLPPAESAPNDRARFVVAVFLLAALAGTLLLSYRSAGSYQPAVGALLVVLLGGAMLSVSGALTPHQ
jgi:hypothetical protein